MRLSDKIAGIKEKIAQLASKMENLRQRDAEELAFMKHQLAVFKERLTAQSSKEVIENEE